MSEMYFDVWASDDLNGTALGELTQAYGKQIRAVDQAEGSGQFTINRHDSQWTSGWCAQDNLIRVRLVTGGPFDYDDERYIHAFFIDAGDDIVLSEAEEGGDEMTRGGPDPVVILRRAVVNYEADVPASQEPYWHSALKDGHVHFLQRNPGEVLRIMLRNASVRSPNPLDPSTHDFSGDGNSTPGRDSSGELWEDSDADWHIPVGMDYLSLLSMLASGEMFWKMGTDLVLHAYDSDQGVDRSGSISFVQGVNIREAAERTVNAREAISRALVQGTTKNGGLTYRWVTDAGTETYLGGRREGFVEYETTPTAARLDKAGTRAIRRRRLKFEGPTTMGVIDTTGQEAFVDYFPGDRVTVDVPGIFDEATPKVYAIVLEERPAGDYDVSLEFEEVPFDPAQGEGPTTADCGTCPPPTPYTPGGVQPGDSDPCWPYDGSFSGTSDTSPADTDTDTTTCFEGGDTYTYDLTMHSDDPGAYSWSWGISNVNFSTGGTQVINYANTASGSDVNLTGTFVAGAGPDGIAVRFWATVADSVHSHRPISGTFSFAPVGFVVAPDVPIPPNTGQPVTGEVPAISIGSTTTTLTVDWPYATGSLRIRVDGVLISAASYVETTPGSGVVTLSWALDADETVTVDYQAAT